MTAIQSFKIYLHIRKKMYQQSANLKLLNMFQAMLKLSQTSLFRAFEFTLN